MLNQSTYKKITGSSYPLNQVVDTIIGIRSQLPEMIIHINATIIRDVNDEVREMNDLINFASRIGGEAKFIDLASRNPHLIVPYEEIIEKIESLGFTKTEEDTWQIFLQRADQRVIVTRCGFSEEAINRGYRNLFLNPDGTIMADNEKGLTVSVLKEIHEQNTEGFAKKVEWYFPPAKRI